MCRDTGNTGNSRQLGDHLADAAWGTIGYTFDSRSTWKSITTQPS